MLKIPVPLSWMLLTGALAIAQEQSVRPGINDSFRNPDPAQFIERFEIESREVFARRNEIIDSLQLKPADTVADIGAGTGLFTRLIAARIAPEGRVIAVDIAQKFLDHIEITCREQNLRNVEVQLCTDDSTGLQPASVDLAFICDTYHHFEYPRKTLTSIRTALKPGGRLVVIDFKRIEGESTDWTMEHVRAGQDVFEAEIATAGFRRVAEVADLLKENYMVVFETDSTDSAAHNEHAEEPVRRGPGRGRGGLARGAGRGPDALMRADQDVFHFLLEKHSLIRRSVRHLENGVETLTESDDPEVASAIQKHASAMELRVREGRGLRFWDELFAAVFRNSDKIRMVVDNTEHGVRVTETSADAEAVRLIQAHAAVVTRFVERGFDEAHDNHPVPGPAPAPGSPLKFPIISGWGGVVDVPQAVDPPRAGAKLVLDVTTEGLTPGGVNKGLDRAARTLNLYGQSGLTAGDIRMTVVLHGEATGSVLTNSAWESRFKSPENPNLPLIDALRSAGVEVLVCGQALHYKQIDRSEVAPEIAVATAALTAVMNRVADGYTCIPVP